MRILRRMKRALVALFVSPPIIGAAYVAVLAIYAGLFAGGVDTDVGDVRRAAAMETFISRRFPAEIVRMRIGVVATAIALGLFIGLLVELLVRLRGSTTTRRRGLHALLLVAFLHSALVLWGMADTPQLYAASWYAQ